MGVNIIIMTKDDWQRHPDWDSSRYGGDRAFWEYFDQKLFEQWTPPGFPYEDDAIYYRPSDFVAFRAAASLHPFPERWMHAADLLEANPDYWLYFSY